MITAALAQGESRILLSGTERLAVSGTLTSPAPVLSEDITATIECLQAVGCKIQVGANEILVQGIGKQIKERLANPEAAMAETMDASLVLPVRASGSTLRFLIPLALSLARPVRFIGERSLFERPLTVYQTLCQQYGFVFQLGETKDSAYLDVCGKIVEQTPEPNEASMTVSIPAGISSQFVTGLLLALPLFGGCGRVELIPPVVSRPYIEMTRQMMERFGIRTCWEKNQEQETILIPGGQTYHAAEIEIEGDESQAAFLKAIPLLDPESDVIVTGLNPATAQGDRRFDKLAELLKEGSIIDLSDTPDLGPILFVLAAASGRGGTFTGTARLREKESDRVLAMAQELARFGIQSEIGTDSFTICPGKLSTPKEPLEGHGDHRIVMALAVLLIRTGGRINGAEAVRKSDPAFFDRLSSLAILIKTERGII